MKKVILSGMGVLFVVAVVLGGCSKPEEKKVETSPAKKMEAVQEKAVEMQQKVTEEAPPDAEAVQGTPATDEEIKEALQQMGQQAMDAAEEKIPEEVKEAVDTAKQLSGDAASGQMEQAATEAAKEAATDAAAKSAESTMEEAVKEKAAAEGMKLPGKY